MKEKDIVKIFKALSDNNRIKILYLLKEQKSTFGDIENNLQLRQSTISHHIKTLREVGLIVEEKQGRNKSYLINKSQVKIIYDYFNNLVK
ncbi:metalloregulator ArsR/SmtB family transcription factor [Tissierella sp. MSJ-40]|jgi:DNA-binding transcriptional ArsR family regulator|uniref:Metalloregulator ArsR/SmtB family transcription factor n=1 Tax=Tissierella simiarum TaxID=2841534 RepID=A0ABS6EBG7_9FIRM|nr:metalloregulator ArsR/SmtB family transcription factor [Tissierella simiarum]MBU5439780.1 metalloregulator ArsR/SmtB family transcription factor [Tissierella simiarum]